MNTEYLSLTGGAVRGPHQLRPAPLPHLHQVRGRRRVPAGGRIQREGYIFLYQSNFDFMLLVLVQVAAMAELYTGDHNAAALLDNLDEITSLPTEFLNIGHLVIVIILFSRIEQS